MVLSSSPFPGQAHGCQETNQGSRAAPQLVWKAEGNGDDGSCWGCCGRGRGQGSAVLTFIARDQRPAFSLEVGRDDVTEAMGQDVVCFIVDVLPAVGTGLKDRDEVRAGKSAPEGPKAELWQCQVLLCEETNRGARKPSSLLPSHGLAPGSIWGISSLFKQEQAPGRLLGRDRKHVN